MPSSDQNTSETWRLLIVEDEFLIGMMAEDALVGAGFEVVGIARTYEEALSLGEVERPDLVLMDIRLASSRDGIDAAIDLRQHLGIVSLFTSANHDCDTMVRAETAAPIGWLPKPYTPDSLVQATRAATKHMSSTSDENS